MKTTKDLEAALGELLGVLLGADTIEQANKVCDCQEKKEDAVETPKSGKVWYVVLDEEGEFDGLVHKTSKALDIREFKGKSLEVFDNYSDANARRKELKEEW